MNTSRVMDLVSLVRSAFTNVKTQKCDESKLVRCVWHRLCSTLLIRAWFDFIRIAQQSLWGRCLYFMMSSLMHVWPRSVPGASIANSGLVVRMLLCDR